MLVLDGPQDIGKSYFVQWVGSVIPDLFIAEPIHPDDKDDQIRHFSKFVWEVKELGQTTRKADVEALKGFLTARAHTVRRAYGRFDIEKPTTASFVGTINNEAGFLVDRTGNRRYLTVTLTSINWDYAVDIDPHQLWAQAFELYRLGATGRLTKDQQELRDDVNSEYEVPDPIMDILQQAFDLDPDSVENPMHTVDIMKWVIEGSDVPGGLSRGNMMTLVSCLKRLGFQKSKNITINGRQTRGFYGIKPKRTQAELATI
jgi:predicted P-loop ATPase